MQPIICVEGVTKAYNESAPILQDVTFKVEPGQFTAVVGPSGCGKTTLLRCIASLMQPDTGSVLHRGQQFKEPPSWLSIVFQDYNRSLFPWLTVRKNVAFGLRDKNGRAERVLAALRSVGLEHAADLYPWQLSGGMQQRCALARSIVVTPQLLLLDEPFASVDAQTRTDLQDMVMDICRRMSLSALLVTHDIDEAVFMADKVVVLSTRPARVVEEIEINLPRSRDQLSTKESPEFLHLRHRVYTLVRQQAHKSTIVASTDRT
ncbi:ABC transporter ATP-binding protein [Microvirga pakistanensis]|uniref:ABC transporter ATP-binding protein n=1 Tax=Microvirga pakistanensis TaxID=1682650 RepID=UPI001FCEEFAF|nr:ABC transporter ATP-binding protein [Microvirga pakistanensis]